ncbi:MAG: tyrosine--tRNA ligase [Rhodospirillaceae bacterium]|nr:tyrosine--tRNA ligase [Rhodospirillaceae bacterium]
MIDTKTEFLQKAQARGYIHQCTDIAGLDTLAEKKPISAYIGFDATANSLHVGSLVPIMLLRLLQRTGHKPIILMGGGTTKVGDPSGKDESRQLLTEDEITSNIAGIKSIFERFLNFGEGPNDAILFNNAEWLDPLEYIPFLRDFGQHFSINRMLGFESVKQRLDREQPLSFLEFNYVVLQAYDFLELSRRADCRLQMGGSDQWGNIVSGIDLARRVDGADLFGLTTPLLTTSSGAKMGKTADGAIWLNEDRLRSYDYWQFWRNTEDADVGRFLKLFTELPISEIKRFEALKGAEINDAKIALADGATALCHGVDAAHSAAETAHKTFGEGHFGEDLPRITVPATELSDGIPAFVLIARTHLAKSNSDARRLIKGGGARLNDKKIEDENLKISSIDINDQGIIKLSAGKKRHALVQPS